MTRMRLGRWTALLACCTAVALPAAARADQVRPDAQALHRAGQWIVDAQGRVFVGHGFNIIKKLTPYYRAEFTEQDARFLADEGFTTARIGFIWAGAEPKPGVYDDAYINRILALDDLLGKYGIRTMVDFHEDLWNSGGGDGAPDWATLGSNFNDDFQHFWNDDPAPDGVGIQTHFVRLWQHIAGMLASHTNIEGLDPFNEPEPGSGYPCAVFVRCPPFENGPLHDFYQRVITAIRAGGAHQVIWPELVADSGSVEPTMPWFSDPQTAFHYHYYCNVTQESSSQTTVGSNSPEAAACQPLEQHNLGNYYAYGQSLGVPLFLGEFSCNDVDDDNAQIVDNTDEHFISWTAWAYYTAADDPADCPNQGLLVDDKLPGSEANAKQPKLDAFVVPHAQAIAGTPQSTSYDRSTKTYKLSYATHAVPGASLAPEAVTQIFVPWRVYPAGYAVKVSGARAVSAPGAAWLLLKAAAGAATVDVTVTPGSGPATQHPLSSGVLPLSAPPAAAPRCPAPTGRLAGAALGPVRLGATRPRLRRSLPRFTVTSNGMDDFCLRPGFGIRVGYVSPRLARSLPRAQRARLRGTAVLALTANRRYALDGVRPGTRLTAALERRLRIGRPLHLGHNAWYFASAGRAEGVLKVQRGTIREVGIATRAVSATRAAQRRLLFSFP